jgi:hypothetical protein
MITYDMTIGDWTSYEIHLGYLRQTILFHGGVEALGWQGWFAHAYTWAELRWANRMVYEAGIERPQAHIIHQRKFTAHPVSTDMCAWVSRLPVGFHTIAKSNLLGAKVGEFLEEVADWTRQCKPLNKESFSLGKLNTQGLELARKCATIICSGFLSQVEHLVCIAMMAYIISLFEGTAGHSRGLEDLTANIDWLDLESMDEECRIWVATTVAAANDTFPITLPNRWTLLDRVMEFETASPSWSEAMEIFRKFFWDERNVEKWRHCWDTAVQRKKNRRRL